MNSLNIYIELLIPLVNWKSPKNMVLPISNVESIYSKNLLELPKLVNEKRKKMLIRISKTDVDKKPNKEAKQGNVQKCNQF